MFMIKILKYSNKKERVKNVAITKDDVMYIAKLAKLRFDDEEAVTFASEFEIILDQFKTLDNLKLDELEITRPNEAVVRKDVCKKCEINDLYRNVKLMRETLIEVPKIIE